MKKKIIFILALMFSFALASCNKNETVQNKKDRGQRDDSISNIDIPEELIPNKSTTASYLVKHMLENSNGEYEIVEAEDLKGDIGSLTTALVKTYNGYTADSFEQKEITADGKTVIEIKYKASKYVLSLYDIEASKGTISGSGEFFAYDNKVQLIAKPNIGYEFVGWFNGEEKLSGDKSYIFEIDKDMNISAQFKIADDFKYYEFESDQSSCVINKFLGNAPDELIIPENVTQIAEEAFENADLNKVVLPKTLEVIEQQAFSGSSIKLIVLNSAPQIGSSAFSNCVRLYEVYNLSDLPLTIGEYVNGAIAYYAMAIHESLEEESIYKTQGDFLFAVSEDSVKLVSYTGNADDVVLPSEIKIEDETYDSYTIGIHAFKNNDLNVVTIPNAVTSIEPNAFIGCKQLYEIYDLTDNLNISTGVSSNGSVAYYAVVVHDSADEPRSVVKTDKMTYVIQHDDNGEYAELVSYNDAEKDLLIDSLDGYKAVIGKKLFSGNETIETVTLGENVIKVLDSAFYQCKNLKEVIADNVIYVGSGSFQGCENLKKASLNKCITIDSSAFSADYCLNNVNIPKVETINTYAFYYCYSLYQIILPETLNSIGNYAFNYCYKLRNVVNKSSKYIYTNSSSNGYVGYYANEITTKDATTVQIQKDTTYIIEATDTSYLKSLLITYLVKTNQDEYEDVLDAYYFDGTTSNYSANNVYKLTEQVNGTSKTLGDLTIDGTTGELNPTGSYSQMNAGCKISFTATNDGQFVITSNISYHNYTIKSGEAEAVPATIDNYYTNENGYITYNNGEKTLIAYIGNEKELIVPSDVTKIDQGAFAYGDYTKIIIPSTATLSSSIFYNCNNLEVLDLPCNNLEDIFDALYYYSDASTPTKLRTLRLSGENISIDSYDLENMTNLENLIIAGEFSTYFNVFSNNTYLKNFYFEGTLKEWTSISFDSEGENVSPMVQASNFYLLDEEGETEILNKKFKLLDELTIPSDITSIGDNQFNGFGIKKLTIPDTLINIGKYAFANCNELVEVNLNKRTVIDTGMFAGCTKLQNINLPKELTTIEDYAFAGCNNLKKISLNDNISEIGEYAFNGCSSLNNVIIPSSVTIIKEGVFNSCYGLQKVVLPELTKNDENITVINGITDIYDEAFANCYVLNSINLPSTLTTIGEGAFKNCEALRSVSIKDTSITVIPAYLFSGCRNLSNFEFSNSIVEVGDHAFDNCKKLVLNHAEGGNYFGPEDEPYKWFIKADSDAEEIVIKDECEIILDSAFVKAKALKSLVIPNTITKLGQILTGNYTIEYLEMPFLGNGTDHAFINYTFGDSYNTSSYTKVPSSLTTLKLTGNFDTIETKAFYNASSISTIILPDTVKYINNNAFEGCGIVSFDSKNVTNIGEYAFYKSKLTSITIRDKVNEIGRYAFRDCSKLLTADLSNVTGCSIGLSLFYNCTALTTANLSNDVSIQSEMFYNCNNLSSITIPTNTKLIGDDAFYNTGIKSIVVPENIEMIATNAFRDSALETADLSAMKSDSTIGESAFYDCSNLEEVILPNITKINDNTFRNCSKLTKCDIPDTITSIGARAFSSSGLKSIVLPAGLEKANGATYEFASSSNLEEVTIKSTAETYLSSSAFSECKKLKTVNFVEGVTTVSNSLFVGRSSITTVNMASTITLIAESAFSGCGLLTSIVIPENVVSIGNNAFNNCPKLLEIYNLSSLELELGSDDYGQVAKNAIAIHNSLDDDSIYVKDNDGFVFIQKDGKVYLFDYNGTNTEIILPSSVTKNNVTYNKYDIYNGVFKNNKNIAKVYIPSAVEVIKANAFENCSNITNVIIEEGLKTIESQAFKDCTNLINISIPSSLEALYDTFTNCNKLTYRYSNSNKYLGNDDNNYVVFVQISSINANEVNIEDGCRVIAPSACQGLNYVTDIELKEGIVFIGARAFSECRLLANFTFPTTLKTIGAYSFKDSFKLKKVLLENTNVESIESFAFDMYQYKVTPTLALTEVTLPNTLKDLGNECFGATGITSIAIPNGVTKLERTFYECSKLESIILPNSIKTIGGFSIYGCSLKNIELPNSIEEIESNAFDITLTNVYFDGTIDDWCGIKFSSSSSNPMNYATNFYILDSNGTVEFNGNHYSSITEIELTNATKIGSYQFYGFTNLNDVILSNTIETCEDYAFIGFEINNVYYNGTIEDWCNIKFNEYHSNPMNYATNFYILDNDGDVEKNGNKYSLLTELVIPDTVTSIGTNQFYGFKSLTKVEVPNSVTSIGIGAFGGCSSLETIKLPFIGNKRHVNGDTYQYPLGYIFGKNEYSGSTGVKQYYIGESNTNSNYNATYYIPTTLTTVILTDSTYLPSGSFYNCTQITKIVLPKSINAFGTNSFYNHKSNLEVYYGGTSTELIAASKYGNNSNIVNMTDVKKYYYSEEEPAESNKYWHYVDGEPTIWVIE